MWGRSRLSVLPACSVRRPYGRRKGERDAAVSAGPTEIGSWIKPLPACKELDTLMTDYFTLQQMNRAFVNIICWGAGWPTVQLLPRTALSWTSLAIQNLLNISFLG